MAKNKDDNTKSNIKFNALKKIAGLIQSNTDDIYKSTYYTDPENKRQLDNLKNNIDTSIKNILNNNINSTGEPNMSRFYERLFFNTQNDKDTVAEFEKIFGDNDFINNLSSSYMDNRWIKAIDDELDETLRYMPKLEEALQTLRDNVLSADSFNKDFLTLKPAIDGDGSQDQFDHNIQDLKKNYDLLKLINDIYYDTSKYGETFIYCVPYEKAIQNIKNEQLDDRIHVHLIDGAAFETNKIYDLIFIDAAKSQYRRYLEHFMKNSRIGTVFIFDNLNFHGIVDNEELSSNRSTIQMVHKIKKFREHLLNDDRFTTAFYDVGDGIAVSVRKI